MRKSSSLFILSALLAFVTASQSAFAQERNKTVNAVLVDNTLSLRKQFPQVLRLTGAIVTRVHERGPVILFSFIRKPDAQFLGVYDRNDAHEGRSGERASAAIGVDWTQNEASFSEYLKSLALVRGNTDLFNSIQSAAEAVYAKANGETDSFETKTIILITDGEHRMRLMGGSPDDEDYERKQQEQILISLLKESGIRILAVGLLQDLNSSSGRYRVTTRERAESFLKRITKQTGGRVVFPKSKKFDVDAVVKELLPE